MKEKKRTTKSAKMDTLKKRLVKAMQKNLGNVMASCAQVKCDRQTYYNYYNKDNKFKKEIDDIVEMAIDFAEGKLFSLINDENPTAILFFLKTRAKHRGYIERQEIESKNLNVNYDNEIKEESTQQEASQIYQSIMKGKE